MLLNNIYEKSQSPIVNGKAIQKHCKKCRGGGGGGRFDPPNPCMVKILKLGVLSVIKSM